MQSQSHNLSTIEHLIAKAELLDELVEEQSNSLQYHLLEMMSNLRTLRNHYIQALNAKDPEPEP